MEQSINVWHDVFTPKDAGELLNAYGGFHDSCIVSVNFKSGMYVHNKTMHCETDNYELHMIFHSQWNDYALELCFTQVRKLHLVGLEDNYFGDIYGASIQFCNNLLPAKYRTSQQVIVWADSEDFDPKDVNAQLSEPDDTYVIAQTLKWRLVEKQQQPVGSPYCSNEII